MGWREIERILTESFRRDGFRISQAGDTFAETSGFCQMAQIGEAQCGGSASRVINLTSLAKEIAQ